MQPFTIVELSMFCVAMLSAFGGLLTILQHSKCEDVSCLCFKCKRPKEAILADVENQAAQVESP